MLGAALVVGALLSGYAPAEELCALRDGRIAESSGLAAVGERLFTHNDSGDGARFFELDRDCRTVAVHRVSGASPVDWEDVAPGPGGTLWFADTGDNRARRRTVALHRVDVPPTGSTATTTAATTYRFRYEDGPHDAEALLVHPRTGEVVVVTKDVLGRPRAYAPDGPLDGTRTGVLRRAGDIAPLGLAALGGITGGAVSPTGDRVALRSLTTLYEWPVGADGLAAALAGTPSLVVLPRQHQGESIAYRSDGAVLVGTEGRHAPLHVLAPSPPGASPSARPPSPLSATAPAAVPLPPGGPLREPMHLAVVSLGVAASALAVVAAWRWSSRRRRMHGR